jgi:hypothetical protein
VASRADLELVADIVNQAHPGRATFALIPESDHTFKRHPTMRASLQATAPAPPNPAMRERLLRWLDAVEGGAAAP